MPKPSKLDPDKRYRLEGRGESVAIVEERPPPRPPLRPRLSVKEALARIAGRSTPEPEPEPETAPPAPNAEIAVGDAEASRVEQAERRRDAELVDPSEPPPALVPGDRRQWRGGACVICGRSVPLRRATARVGRTVGRTCPDCPSASVLAGEHVRFGADATTAVLQRAQDVLTDSHPTVSVLASAWSEADHRSGLASIEVGGQYWKLNVREAVFKHLTWSAGGVIPDVDAEPFWHVDDDPKAIEPPAPRPHQRDPRRLLRCTWCGSEPDADPDTDPVTVGTLTGRLCGQCEHARRTEPADQPGRAVLDRLIDVVPDTDAARRASTLIEAAWSERSYRDLWVDGEHRARRESLSFASHVARTRRAGAGDPDQEPPAVAFGWHRPEEEVSADDR